MVDTIFKEAADLLEAMGRKLFDVSVVTELRIVSTDRYNLVILLTLKDNVSRIRTSSLIVVS